MSTNGQPFSRHLRPVVQRARSGEFVVQREKERSRYPRISSPRKGAHGKLTRTQTGTKAKNRRDKNAPLPSRKIASVRSAPPPSRRLPRPLSPRW